MYRRSASKNPRKDSAGFYTLRGRKFPYGNFRTTLERPAVRILLVSETLVSRQFIARIA